MSRTYTKSATVPCFNNEDSLMVDDRPNNVVRLYMLHQPCPSIPFSQFITSAYLHFCSFLLLLEVVIRCYRQILYGHPKISDRVDTAVKRKCLILSLFPFLFQVETADRPTTKPAARRREIDNRRWRSFLLQCSIQYTLTSMAISHLLAQPMTSRTGAMLTMCKCCIRCLNYNLDCI